MAHALEQLRHIGRQVVFSEFLTKPLRYPEHCLCYHHLLVYSFHVLLMRHKDGYCIHMNDWEKINKKCIGDVQSNPAVKIFGNADDRTTARTSYPSSVKESKSLPYVCKNSVENALTGPLFQDLHVDGNKSLFFVFEKYRWGDSMIYVPGKFHVKYWYVGEWLRDLDPFWGVLHRNRKEEPELGQALFDPARWHRWWLPLPVPSMVTTTTS